MEVNTKKMLESVDFIAKESIKMLNQLNKNGLNDLLTDEQKKQIKDIKKDLNVVTSRDINKFNDIINKFN